MSSSFFNNYPPSQYTPPQSTSPPALTYVSSLAHPQSQPCYYLVQQLENYQNLKEGANVDIVPGLHTARKMPGWHDQHSGLVGSQCSMAAPISLMLITGLVNFRMEEHLWKFLKIWSLHVQDTTWENLFSGRLDNIRHGQTC